MPSVPRRVGWGYAPATGPGGLRPRRSPAHPAPSRLKHIGPAAKTLAAEADFIAKFADKFLLEAAGPLAGNDMNAGAPARGGIFARKQLRTSAQDDEMKAKAALIDIAAHVSGMGIAIVSRLIVALELQTGSLGIIPMKDLTIQRPLHLQRIQGRSQSPAQAKFLEVLKALTPHQPNAAG